jgi:hypothetical protein
MAAEQQKIKSNYPASPISIKIGSEVTLCG